MSQAIWTSQTGGDWSNPDNWQGSIVPGPGDSVTITSTVAETITISTSMSVQSLVVDDPAAAVDLLSAGTVTATGDIEINARTLVMDGSLVSGGTVSLAVPVSLDIEGRVTAPSVVIQAPTLSIVPDVTVSIGSIAAVLYLGTPTIVAAETTPTAIFTGGETLELGAARLTGTPWTLESDGAIITTGDISEDGVVTVSCFAAGTRIATPDGSVTVDRLVFGDVVSLVDGGSARIIWIGRRRVDCRRHPEAERVWPVRIEAHAFGLGRPHAPLFLSPDHAVFVDGVLVPVKLLVNGVTIRQIPVSQVTYYHLELARHDIVLAEGLPVETYLDTGGRAAFGDEVAALHPEFGAPDDLAMAIWRDRGYAPLISDMAVLERIHVRLAAQAGMLADRLAG